MKKSLLIAEDDEHILELLLSVFSRPDLHIHAAPFCTEAIGLIDHHDNDVVLTDLVMPGGDGLAVLSHAKKTLGNCEVILMTGYGTVENAVQAMKLGAFHYITKPFQGGAVVVSAGGAGVGEGPSTVLSGGEGERGKDLTARPIHYNSNRADRMLVPVNCSAIPAELLESELFGHVRGAFTGAHIARTGRFETAHRGTIFLDEIGEMSPPLQAKILRVLQKQSFTPVGGTKAVDVDGRVIAATNKDLGTGITAGRFRQDLAFRLNVIPIHLPPLRERTDDIPVLAEHFLGKYAPASGQGVKGFRPDAMEAMKRYAWPGNVRELENLVERLVVLSRGGWAEKKDLPPAMLRGEDGPGRESAEKLRNGGLDFRKAREDFENHLIRQALALTGGNRNKAAALLGLKRTTLLEMLKRKRLHGP